MRADMQHYADLVLSLHRYAAKTYSIGFRYSHPDSETDTSLGQAQAIQVRIDSQVFDAEVFDPIQYGQALTTAFFGHNALKTAFAQALSSAQSQNIPLRIRLWIGPSAPELHNLRWELLQDPQDNTPLATNENIYFSRYLSSTDWRPVQLSSKGQLKALAVIANPSDLADYNLEPIDEDAEISHIRAGLGSIETQFLPQGTEFASIENILAGLRTQVDILVLVAHGAILKDRAVLYLQDKGGRVEPIYADEFADRIRELQKPPRLALILSCQSAGNGEGQALSALGPRLVEAGIPAVLAMQDNLRMDTAAVFLAAFFKTLQDDGQIDRALVVARGMVRKQPDFWVPALFMRLKSGRVWYTPGFSDKRKGAEKFPALVRNLRRGRCTPIIGPGLSETILGSQRDIARQWAEQYRFPMGAQDKESLPQVAQYLTVNQDLRFPFDELEDHLRKSLQYRHQEILPTNLQAERAHLEDVINAVGRARRKGNPQDGYRILAGLPLSIYITVNQDTLLEDALREAGRTPKTLLCPWNEYIEEKLDDYTDEPSVENPLVFHLFGRWDEPDSVVLTEDNYFDFLIGVTSNKDLIPQQVRLALSNSSLMFLGFRTENWDFRILFRSILAQPGGNRRKDYAQIAAQLEPDDERIIEPQGARRYLEEYFGKNASIDLFWGNAGEFLIELNKAWKRDGEI